MTSKTCWRNLISGEMQAHGESWSHMVFCTLTDHDMDAKFDAGYGSPNGKPFTLWTERRVYFPTCYDGAEGVASVPRDPTNEATDHIGGY